MNSPYNRYCTRYFTRDLVFVRVGHWLFGYSPVCWPGSVTFVVHEAWLCDIDRVLDCVSPITTSPDTRVVVVPGAQFIIVII